jgi:hypothetical protein
MPLSDEIVTVKFRKVLDRNESNTNAAVMPAETVTLKFLPGAERVLAEHRQELPQKNELCGAFWVTLGLRAFANAKIEQDHVGLAASSLLSVVQVADSLPPGHPGRDDYILDLNRAVESDIDSGTSSQGLQVATSQLSEGAFTSVPVSGEWTSAKVAEMLSRLFEADVSCLVMSNSATRFLWNSHMPSHAALEFLFTGSTEVIGSEWNVGHFLCILGYVEGPHGTLALCADTYPSLGSAGLHLQPLDGIAASLRRDDSPYSGGMLVMVATANVSVIVSIVEAIGLTTEIWDNGTPYQPVEELTS